jgi:hypothetical protein
MIDKIGGFLISGFLLLNACNDKTQKENQTSRQAPRQITQTDHLPSFSAYWYNGKAEVSSYALEQARYGELRKGDAELIFVTEDFSKSRLVKLDNSDAMPNDVLKVMKLNMTKKFNTGIYPYSMMLSVFSSVYDRHVVKAAASVQEWCGHTYSQLKEKDNRYHFRLDSYFEKEVEIDTLFARVWLEDELLNRIRMNPSTLPSGEIQIFPGLLTQRLRHSPCRPAMAIAQTAFSANEDSLPEVYRNTARFKLIYPKEQRELVIYYEKSFPYTIRGWEETYPDGFGSNKKTLTTRAVLKKSLLVDYWNHNAVADSVYRDSLDLNRISF